ncbi:helix-turn-helix domain-containing protein, partial [Listeria ivanovii subsp. londoniensis]|nr:helix-turn-helix domain-containing protein [Listeria ivanovii subsp. londoniensis]
MTSVHNSTKLSLDTLNKICHALNITLQEFFLENATTMEKQLFHQIKSLDADQ